MAADSDFGAPKRPATSAGGISGPGGSPDPAPGLIAGCLAAVEAFDSPALDKALRRAEVMLGSQGALQRVVAPLACALGEHWRSGRITAAHEHFCSAALKGWLAQATRSYSAPGNGPGVVVGTPAGQIHELGALLFAATAAQLGWRVTYLGPNLRAPEIAGAAARTGAKAVALSLVYPEDDEQVPGEIAGLRSLLAPSVSLLVGGRAAPAYAEACRAAGAITPASLADIGPALEGLRRGDGADTESAATLPQRLQ